MRSVLPALLAKEYAHGYELKQLLEQTFTTASTSCAACPNPVTRKNATIPSRRRRPKAPGRTSRPTSNGSNAARGR